jgi:hypothetical protein
MTAPAEKQINACLMEALSLWNDLSDKHPSDMQELVLHIHAIQNMLAWRVARRADPETWGVAGEDPNVKR